MILEHDAIIIPEAAVDYQGYGWPHSNLFYIYNASFSSKRIGGEQITFLAEQAKVVICNVKMDLDICLRDRSRYCVDLNISDPSIQPWIIVFFGLDKFLLPDSVNWYVLKSSNLYHDSNHGRVGVPKSVIEACIEANIR